MSDREIRKTGDGADKILLSELIAPAFHEVHRSIRDARHTHYWLTGGRGSGKSSFCAIELVHGLMREPGAHALALRQVKDTLRHSVFEQLVWAIYSLDAEREWKMTVNPMELTFIPTGQRILLRGAENPSKLKSIKLANGYLRYVWFEELDELDGMFAVRRILQSAMRGGNRFAALYTYNPPPSRRHWVNLEASMSRPDRLLHNSTYLDIPSEWLGTYFLDEAEHLKKTAPEHYANEYLGQIVGDTGEVFRNLNIREISDVEISDFDRQCHGLDFGYASDPSAFIACNLDKARRKLYLFSEIYLRGLSNRRLCELICKSGHKSAYITCDSADPRSISELRELGLCVRAAKKGPGSVRYGIKYLASLDEIVIDPARCPNASREFLSYAVSPDSDAYPDRDNHAIDAVRYAVESEMDIGGRFVNLRY